MSRNALLKSVCLEQGLKIIDFQMPDYLRVLENGIQFGNPVLLQNIQEDLDPSLNPVLNKSVTRIGWLHKDCYSQNQKHLTFYRTSFMIPLVCEHDMRFVYFQGEGC